MDFYYRPRGGFAPIRPDQTSALARSRRDGQYCPTEMENSFVGQVICRNCGFSLISHPLSLSFSLTIARSSFMYSHRSFLRLANRTVSITGERQRIS